MKKIEYKVFLDKVHGCWYGKCLGGAAGAPVEGIKDIVGIDDFTEIFNPNLPNDDLDLQLLWLEVLETKGTLIDSCDLADAWIEKCWYPFSEYGYFMKNYMRGVKPPYSGVINNSFFKEGMGCPIRSEIWGIICAGNPKLASQYAYMDGTLDHAENSVYAEQFLAAIESLAFFCNDMEALVCQGMEYIPPDCKLSKCFQMIIEEYHKGTDWQKLRKMVLNKYSHPDFTNVVQNLAFVLISLLYGQCDMRKTINIALKCGYDTDCTCASAASVVGIIKGYQGLDEKLTGLIKDYFICGIDVVRPTNSIKDLAKDSALLALKAPNEELLIENAPFMEDRPQNFTGFVLEKVTEEGLKVSLDLLKPLSWEVYGPYFEQLDQPANTEYPQPHAAGSNLPDIVCMVNNEVFLGKEYIQDLENETPAFIMESKEDLLPFEEFFTMEGQMCCYAKTTVKSPCAQKVWLIVGNNDGFRLEVNGKKLLEKDEIRLWTPYNNFTLVDFNEGNNEIILKLLRRTEKLKFSIGFRIYDGNHWHRSKWHTDLYS